VTVRVASTYKLENLIHPEPKCSTTHARMGWSTLPKCTKKV